MGGVYAHGEEAEMEERLFKIILFQLYANAFRLRFPFFRREKTDGDCLSQERS